MLFPSYAVLLGAGLIANYRDWRMLALTVLIGVNVFIPIPGSSAFEFYGYCILAELCVIIGATFLQTRSSIIVIELATVLIALHVMAYYIDGHPPLSPYRVLVKLCEYALLCTSIIFSQGFLPSMRNRMTKCED